MGGWVRPVARRDGVVAEPVGAEIVACRSGTDQAYALSAAASTVWRACDGTLTVADIVRRTAIDEAVVLAALDELAGCGLLEPLPQTPAGVSRRALMVGAAAGVAVPLVTALVLPDAAAAASTAGGPGGTTVPPPPPPGPPVIQVTLTRTPGTAGAVPVSNGQSLLLNSEVDTFTFDASGTTDPAGGTIADGTLSFHWVIIYTVMSGIYTDAGITGYRKPVLTADRTALIGTTGSDLASIRLTVQSVLNPGVSSEFTIKMTVQNSGSTLLEYVTCQNDPASCGIPALLPTTELV